MPLNREDLVLQERFRWIMRKIVLADISPKIVAAANPLLNRTSVYNAFRIHPRYAIKADIVQTAIDCIGWDWKAYPPAPWEKDFDYREDAELRALATQLEAAAATKNIVFFIRAEKIVGDVVAQLMLAEAANV